MSAEEADKLPGKGKGRTTVVRIAALQLEVGQAVKIEKAKDWFGKRAPYYVFALISKQTGRVFQKKKLADGTGWVVTRVK